ncbi:MAG: nickel pincer cofactor biosynthesis protein LarC [Deltaproteobacteria bacterium]|nr:nickel pincer cofactor biosynthesis protein LarC [Deltaproteobacteria bacterium]
MSRVLVLEPIGGISGDLCLAALLHLGDRTGQGAALRKALADALGHLAEAAGAQGIDLRAVRLVETLVEVSGIVSLHVDVRVPAEVQEREPHHRPFRVIRDLLGRAHLPEGARARALATFQRLAEAEGRVHGMAPDEVEFHEVGGVDSIVDLTGTALLLDALGVDTVYALPPPSGGGVIQSAHGVIPVPPPATLEVMRGRMMRPSGPGERTTPTGAAIVAALTQHAEALPQMELQGTGYGAGTRRWPDAPNVLRATLGTLAPGAQTGVLELSANLDDLSPQLVSAALQALLSAGALDAWVVPVVMKKGRPGHLLSALCTEDERAVIESVFFRETSTLGVRARRVSRTVLERKFVAVDTAYGAVRIKLGLREGAVLNAAPEFDDCAHAAEVHGVAVREVQAAALAAYRAPK